MTTAEGEPADGLPDVAPQLRALRRRRGLTLEAAARRAGLSPAHLSRLETGRRQPSLPMLLGLARTYGTTVSELLGEAAHAADPVVRADRAEPVEAGGWTYHQAGAASRAMQALRVEIPYTGLRDTVRVHPGEEWMYVLAGRVRLALGDAVHVLDPGDSAHFDSLTPHRIAAATRGGAELLFVHTLMQSPAADLCLGEGVPQRH
ncbi:MULTISPECIES: XRE family transcriptional regulator [Streptomyces]|uniref:XRE family transcriptional regulator n=1 Tax=Streptomyces sudanensis TaxID=436397 RepID=A0ABY4TFY7_9ACTN|nr:MULTISPECIES: XRE family transcriptional regulator [Streptomyces]MCP9956472.1 XRE family transcriptional regulator [Streptomyces sudanensis]MCP9985673.1 XRE family transcriptional regulator [Streptomyces sudanensis]MCQ0002915.1 XRE family transcriptional regulator [Streptomyces sudanensis]URN17677.1 XRE family transcriptional regulator [Streptomyces sudanensis]